MKVMLLWEQHACWDAPDSAAILPAALKAPVVRSNLAKVLMMHEVRARSRRGIWGVELRAWARDHPYFAAKLAAALSSWQGADLACAARSLQAQRSATWSCRPGPRTRRTLPPSWRWR